MHVDVPHDVDPSSGRSAAKRPAAATSAPSASAVLLLSCRDQPGLVAAVSAFLFEHGGNILHADQHIDPDAGVFFQRVEFDLGGFELARDEIVPAFKPVIDRFEMQCELRFSDETPRVAVLASKQPHCLYDLLGRWQDGELRIDVPVVISNHPDHAAGVRFLGADYEYLPVTPETKETQERAVIDVLRAYEIDLVVLARYMQILSPSFVAAYPNRSINIHHSFLPAFVGARPYHQAYERGVKLIGVTAHYVTTDLDQGPIIDQDVVRVNQRDSVEDLIRKGRDLEKVVLARAVRAHLGHRVLVYGNKTVVFG